MTLLYCAGITFVSFWGLLLFAIIVNVFWGGEGDVEVKDYTRFEKIIYNFTCFCFFVSILLLLATIILLTAAGIKFFIIRLI